MFNKLRYQLSVTHWPSAIQVRHKRPVWLICNQLQTDITFMVSRGWPTSTTHIPPTPPEINPFTGLVSPVSGILKGLSRSKLKLSQITEEPFEPQTGNRTLVASGINKNILLLFHEIKKMVSDFKVEEKLNNTFNTFFNSYVQKSAPFNILEIRIMSVSWLV